LSNFLTLVSELDQLLSSECLDAKQSLILAEIKLKRLETYVGSSNKLSTSGAVQNSQNPLIPAYNQVNTEKEELRKRLKEAQDETRKLKKELERLEDELRVLAVAQKR
jgi:predicted nuclease with TOPRIM domain